MAASPPVAVSNHPLRGAQDLVREGPGHGATGWKRLSILESLSRGGGAGKGWREHRAFSTG